MNWTLGICIRVCIVPWLVHMRRTLGICIRVCIVPWLVHMRWTLGMSIVSWRVYCIVVYINVCSTGWRLRYIVVYINVCSTGWWVRHIVVYINVCSTGWWVRYIVVYTIDVCGTGCSSSIIRIETLIFVLNSSSDTFFIFCTW